MFQDLDHEARIQDIEHQGMMARRRGDPHLTNPYYRGSDEDARAWTRGYDREMRANAEAAKAAAQWIEIQTHEGFDDE